MPAPQNPNDSKIEQEESDQSQPMDLAQRISLSPAVPLSLQAPAGPVTMRTHIDPSKPGFMTLHMRVPRSSAQAANQIISSSSMLPASIATAQHLTRPALRISSGESPQCHTGGSAPSAFSSTSTSYVPPPTSGALVSARHVPIAAMHPVVTLGTSTLPGNATMASIIRGNHSATQSATAGHLINTSHLPYSSHVPRGPAAVANISAAPKSAVATPILRPAHTSAPVTLPVPVSAAISSSHIQITPRPAAVAGGRTITPPMPKSASPSLTMPQVIDLQKSAHGPVSHLAQTRTMDPAVWTGISHAPATNKQVHISQPVVQQIQQQVSEQGFYKSPSSIANIVTATTTHPVSNTAVSVVSSPPSVSPSSNLSIIHHSSLPPSTAAVARPCTPIVTICATPISTPSTQAGGIASSRTALVQQPSLQVITHTTASQLSAHPTVTVVSGKSISQMVHTVTPLQQQSAQAVTIAAPPTRTTKVYPQQIPTTSHSVLEPSENRSIYVAQPQQNLTCCANTVTTVVLSENCNEGGASVRLASLPRTGVPAGNSFAMPYYPVGRTTITMHPYTGSAPPQGFAAAIASTPTVRPGIIAQQASGSLVTTAQTSSHTVVTTNVAPVRPLNSVMVTVDPSRHHVALHSAYGSSAGAGLSTSDAAPSQATSTGTAMYTVTNSINPTVGLLQSGYGSQQGQSTLPNHSTSPRPSILRKRTSEGVTSVAKKNLLASLPPSGPASPRLETSSSGNVNTISSPKPQSINDQQRENGSTSSNTGSDISDNKNNISSVSILPSVQESLDTTDQSSCTSVEMSNKLLALSSVPVEASPRKKPRKQQLAANELIEAHSSDGEDDFEKDVKDTIRKETVKEEEENVKYVSICKRPKISLMTGYHHAWKSRHNHFAKYTDVKPKEEKRQTVNDLANQKGILQKANGWKIFHLTTQMDEVVELEDSVYGRLSQLLEFVENNPPAWKTKPLSLEEERVLNKISDLIKGNLQRSKIVQDQVGEAKQQVLKMLEHKPHIIDIISKYISKRTLRKKEKN